ncbi:MAG: glutaredoxin [Klebsiella sp.]|uniref:glutaredoxin n=1 Tax=Klebsiella sp. TaxID=576 RepID=UPI00290AC663|nr:glutaredoxin [Klebsiella sp.]MDU3363192.1 glutaredoxin [Klebsiella sp.]
MSSTLEKIQRQIAENPILLYMKGSPKLPSCGFSAQAVQALSACGQLWVDGELVGGCDIVIEMYQRGELQQLIKETAAKYHTDEPKAE